MAATTQYLPVAAMFVAIIAGRLLAETGLRTLTTEQKGMLVERFADLRRWQTIALATILLPILGHPRLGTAALGVCWLVVAIVGHRRLLRLGLPGDYVWKPAVGSYLACLGIGVAAVLW